MERIVVEWINPSKSSDVSRSDSDNEDDVEVFPTEKMTQREVEIALGVDPIPRSSSRARGIKKAKTHGALLSKGKGKRFMTGEEENMVIGFIGFVIKFGCTISNQDSEEQTFLSKNTLCYVIM